MAMKIRSCGILACCLIVLASTSDLNTSTRLLKNGENRHGSAGSKVARCTRKLIKRAAVVIFIPRFVFVPVFGPVGFQEIFDWGDPQANTHHGDMSDQGVRSVATQAIGEVLEGYAEQNPKASAKVLMDIREFYLEASGQVSPSDDNKARVTRQDLVNLFDQHPELQEQVGQKFREKLSDLEATREQEASAEVDDPPQDWAHVHLRDEEKI